MPVLGPIISVKPRLGVDLLFMLLFEAQDNPGLSRSAMPAESMSGVISCIHSCCNAKAAKTSQSFGGIYHLLNCQTYLSSFQ